MYKGVISSNKTVMIRKLIFIALTIVFFSDCKKEGIIEAEKQYTPIELITGSYSGKCTIQIDSTLSIRKELPVRFKIDKSTHDSTEIVIYETSYFGTLTLFAHNVIQEGELIKFGFIPQSNYYKGLYLSFDASHCLGTYNLKNSQLIIHTSRTVMAWGIHYYTNDYMTRDL